MKKVITYGTYDLLHYGHIRLLKRAKALGDYLIVGVTSDDFDKTRGKINVQQSLMERVAAVKATGIADEIIVEEYEGQKIDDIKRYDVDIFTVGSDWIGKFDYLNEYCEVVYLSRTDGISSSDIRDKQQSQRLGLVGSSGFLTKVVAECQFVNGIHAQAIYAENKDQIKGVLTDLDFYNNYDSFLNDVDAIYVHSLPQNHFDNIKVALSKGKHVLCVSPIALGKEQSEELFRIARTNNCILMDAIKTAYSTAFSRMILLAKSGKIGDPVFVEATCTSLTTNNADYHLGWNSICDWGPTALLPVFRIFGTHYNSRRIITKYDRKEKLMDSYSRIDFLYSNGVGCVNVGKGVKSEGELIISGTKGYIYVPAPWWKTDYFEVRFENPADNKRYFYQLDGEGIRNELVSFLRSITNGKSFNFIEREISIAISEIMNDFYKGNSVIEIS